jgi:hypothetical protein
MAEDGTKDVMSELISPALLTICSDINESNFPLGENGRFNLGSNSLYLHLFVLL